MQKIISCRVTDEYVQGTGAVVGAVGSHDDAALELSFSEIWDGTTKRIVWYDALGQNPTLTILTVDLLVPGEAEVYRVPIPGEAKTVAGNLMMTIRGVVIGDDGKEEKAVVSATATFVVLDSVWDDDASESEDITPSQAEQLQKEVDSIKMDISKTIQAVDKLDEYVEVTGKNADAAETAEENAKKAQSAAAASATASSNSASLAGTNAANAAKSAEEARQAATDANGVLSFNGRKGAVLPKSGDYTAEMVGGVAVKGTWTTYSRIELLGLTEATATMEGIINALPNYSEITVAISTAWTSADVPTKYGTLHVVKIYAGRAYAKFEESGGTHFGTFNGNNVFSGWTKLATTDYAVNKAGDIMTGTLSFRPSGVLGYSQIYKNATVSGDYGTLLADRDGNGNFMALKLDASRSYARITLGSTEYDLLHTGNKPSGSYTGNGSSVERTIEIGGIGGTCIIFGYGGFALVTYQGAIVMRGSTAQVSILYNTQCKYQNGVLTIATDNVVVNNNGTTMYYQVL